MPVEHTQEETVFRVASSHQIHQTRGCKFNLNTKLSYAYTCSINFTHNVYVWNVILVRKKNKYKLQGLPREILSTRDGSFYVLLWIIVVYCAFVLPVEAIGGGCRGNSFPGDSPHIWPLSANGGRWICAQHGKAFAVAVLSRNNLSWSMIFQYWVPLSFCAAVILNNGVQMEIQRPWPGKLCPFCPVLAAAIFLP